MTKSTHATHNDLTIDRRWKARQAQIRYLNNNRIIELNQRRQRYNEQHPERQPLPMIDYTQHLMRQHGFDKALKRLRELSLHGLPQTNVIPFPQSARA